MPGDGPHEALCRPQQLLDMLRPQRSGRPAGLSPLAQAPTAQPCDQVLCSGLLVLKRGGAAASTPDCRHCILERPSQAALPYDSDVGATAGTRPLAGTLQAARLCRSAHSGGPPSTTAQAWPTPHARQQAGTGHIPAGSTAQATRWPHHRFSRLQLGAVCTTLALSAEAKPASLVCPALQAPGLAHLHSHALIDVGPPRPTRAPRTVAGPHTERAAASMAR